VIRVVLHEPIDGLREGDAGAERRVALVADARGQS